MIEQIRMRTLGKQFDPFRLIGGAIDPQTHFNRYDLVLLAVQNENRSGDGANVVLIALFVGE